MESSAEASESGNLIAVVVGVERLALEGDEDRAPGAVGEVHEQRAVLERPVVLRVRAVRVALVHVDVVDSLIRAETPERALAGSAVAEGLPERVDGRLLRDRLLDERVDGAVQRRGRAGLVEREQLHFIAGNQTLDAHEVERQVVVGVGDGRLQRKQAGGHGRGEVLLDAEQHFRTVVGLDVDRDVMMGAVRADQVDVEVRLVMRAARGEDATGDGGGCHEGITRDTHEVNPFNEGKLRMGEVSRREETRHGL